VRTISHRELRNNSAGVLRAVGAGETIEVTKHGEVAAVLVPPSLTPYERLVPRERSGSHGRTGR
jgi:prevent-host-death family protein